MAGPISSMTPAASMPGMWGGRTSRSASAREPLRSIVSVGLTGGGVVADPHFPGPGVDLGQRDDLQGLRAPELDDTYSSHGCLLT